MPSFIQEKRVVYVAGHGHAVVTSRVCYVGRDRPRVLILWCPAVRAKHWRLIDRPGCIEVVARDHSRFRGLQLECVRIVEALHADEFTLIECHGPGPSGRPILGSFFPVDRQVVERWVGGYLRPIDLPASPGVPANNGA